MATAELSGARIGGVNLAPFAVAVAVVGVIVLAPGIALRERADNHANLKHGASAAEFVRRQNKRDMDVYYSVSREMAMIVGCDCETAMCANVLVGMRGRPMAPGAEVWSAMAGHVEITHLWRAGGRMARVLIRDGYVRVWPPAAAIPPVWERCTS